MRWQTLYNTDGGEDHAGSISLLELLSQLKQRVEVEAGRDARFICLGSDLMGMLVEELRAQCDKLERVDELMGMAVLHDYPCEPRQAFIFVENPLDN